MKRVLVCVLCACVSLAAAGVASGRSKNVYLSQIEAHVDTVLKPGFVEGEVTAAAQAPARCTSRRRVVIVAESGKALASGLTRSDGTFSIRYRGNAQRARVKQRRWERGRDLTICEKAETFISFFIPAAGHTSRITSNG